MLGGEGGRVSNADTNIIQASQNIYNDIYTACSYDKLE